jgi:hypothetical protein
MRNMVLVTAVLALGAVNRPALAQGATALDGKWTIVYAEEGGRRNNSWEMRPATFKGDTLTYDDNGKERALHLKFGPHQTVTVTGVGKDTDKTFRGVCIVSQSYLCISVSAAKPRPEGRGAVKEEARADAPASNSSGEFVVILRRQRSTK